MSILLRIIGVLWAIFGFIVYKPIKESFYQSLLEGGGVENFTLVFWATFAIMFILPALVLYGWGSRMHSGSIKKCPDCAEIIKREAAVCKHCGKILKIKAGGKQKGGIKLFGLDIFVWLLAIGVSVALFYGNQ
jgi:hypothetical protein